MFIALLCGRYIFCVLILNSELLYAVELGIGSTVLWSAPQSKGNNWVREGESNRFLFMKNPNHQNTTKKKQFEGYLVQYTMLLSLPSCHCESSDKSYTFFSQYTKAGNSNDVCKAPWDLWVKNANSMLIFFFFFFAIVKDGKEQHAKETLANCLFPAVFPISVCPCYIISF